MKTKHFNLLILFLLVSILIISPNSIMSKLQGDKEHEEINPVLSSNFDVVYDWNRTWGTITVDEGKEMVIDSLNNIYIAGDSDLGDFNVSVVKYDNSGTLLWNRTWGFPDTTDRVKGLGLDSSDNIYLVISSYNITTSGNIFLVKYNNIGEIQWESEWGGDDSDYPSSFVIDSSDNIYIGGATHSYGTIVSSTIRSACLLKYDSSGTRLWNRTWNGNKSVFRSLRLDSSGNIYGAGDTDPLGDQYMDIFLVKYNDNGDQLWNRTWGGADSEGFQIMKLDSLDNIYLAGVTNSFGAGGADSCLIKYNSGGTQMWNYTWGRTYSDLPEALAIDSKDNIYCVGYSQEGAADYFTFMLKFNSSGHLLWENLHNRLLVRDADCILIDVSDNIFIGMLKERAGSPFADIFLVKYNKSGSELWNYTYGTYQREYPCSIAFDSIGNLYIAGYTEEFWVTKNAEFLLLKYKNLIPEISIISPIQNDFFGGTPPNFEIIIEEANLEATWYTLDNGIANITFEGLTGTINQTEWDKKPSGVITIRFYAGDNWNLTGFEEIIVRKDITPPNTNILFEPYNGSNNVVSTTTFTLAADDGSGVGVSTTYYKINNSGWIEYSGSFDLSSYDNGYYLISYHSIDVLGNTENEKSILIKLIDAEAEEPIIFGYNFILLLSVILISSIILVRIRHKRKIK